MALVSPSSAAPSRAWCDPFFQSVEMATPTVYLLRMAGSVMACQSRSGDGLM